MKIVLAHNYYQLPGGEDQVFADEAWLLQQHGHEIVRFEKRNSDISKMGRFNLATSAIWNREVSREFGELIVSFQPDVVHFHNTFPLMSPAPEPPWSEMERSAKSALVNRSLGPRFCTSAIVTADLRAVW